MNFNAQILRNIIPMPRIPAGIHVGLRPGQQKAFPVRFRQLGLPLRGQGRGGGLGGGGGRLGRGRRGLCGLCLGSLGRHALIGIDQFLQFGRSDARFRQAVIRLQLADKIGGALGIILIQPCHLPDISKLMQPHLQGIHVISRHARFQGAVGTFLG